MNYNSWISKTNWTLIVLVVINVGNTLIPFLPAAAQDTITAILGALAIIFHVSGVKTAAIASAAAGKPVSGQ